MWVLLPSAGVAIVASWGIVRLVRRWAKRHLLDIPNERSSHSAPTPRGGGVVIAAIVSVGLLAGAFLWGSISSVWLIVAGIFIAAVSWYDDLHSIGTLPRFAVHAAAVAFLGYALGVPTNLALPFGLSSTLPVALAVVVAMFWGIGLTNVYNFMDGIDGIAGVQAVVAGAGWTVAGVFVDDFALQLAGVLIAASSVGFLIHNWSPATIFMGDVGSAFLGFVLAGLVLVAGDAGNGRVPLAGVLFVWPFVFDGTFTLFRRLRNGENVLQAHRSHLYQRLVIAGKSHAYVSVAYLAMAAFSTAAGIVWLAGSPGSDILVLATMIFVPAVLITVTLIAERSADAVVASESSAGV